MDLLLHGNSIITDYHNFCNVSIPFLEEYIKRFHTECFLSGIDQSRVDNSTEEWLDTIEDKLEYEAWYLGHWHTDKQIDKIKKQSEDCLYFYSVTKKNHNL